MTDDSKPLKLTKVISVRDTSLAEVLRIKLEGEGIQCMIEGEHQAGLAGVLPMRLLVRETDAERARALIAQFDAEQKGSHESDASNS